MKPKRRNPHLETLTVMHQQLEAQFQQATVLAIGLAMKQLGVTRLVIDPTNLENVSNGEQIKTRVLENGAVEYILETNLSEAIAGDATQQ